MNNESGSYRREISVGYVNSIFWGHLSGDGILFLHRCEDGEQKIASCCGIVYLRSSIFHLSATFDSPDLVARLLGLLRGAKRRELSPCNLTAVGGLEKLPAGCKFNPAQAIHRSFISDGCAKFGSCVPMQHTQTHEPQRPSTHTMCRFSPYYRNGRADYSEGTGRGEKIPAENRLSPRLRGHPRNLDLGFA